MESCFFSPWKKHRQMGNEPGVICDKIQMCNCAYVLTNLECPPATETHHLTHQKFNKFEAFQSKHYDWCGLFSDAGTSQRSFPLVLRQKLHLGYSLCVCKVNGVTCCLGLLLVKTVSTTHLQYFLVPLFCENFQDLQTPCSSVGTTWHLLKFLWKTRKTKNTVGLLNCQLPRD